MTPEEKAVALAIIAIEIGVPPVAILNFLLGLAEAPGGQQQAGPQWGTEGSSGVSPYDD
jgi:hypothetical protein